MVEPLAGLPDMCLDQQGDFLRGPLAVIVPPGHLPPRMLPVVRGLLVVVPLLRSGRKPSRAPPQCRGAGLPGLGSWVGGV